MSTIEKCLLDGRILWIVDCVSSQDKFKSLERRKAAMLNNKEVDRPEEDDEAGGR